MQHNMAPAATADASPPTPPHAPPAPIVATDRSNPPRLPARAVLLGALIAAAPSPVAAAAPACPDPTQALADAQRQARISTTFLLDPYLRAQPIDVTVAGPRARLSGRVDDASSSDLATRIALAVDGISEVDNRIEVTPGLSIGLDANGGYAGRVTDAGIRAAIRARFDWDRRTHGQTLVVDVDGGRVVLSGTVAAVSARTTAAMLAADTRGVDAVSNRIAVRPAAPAAAPAPQPQAVDETDAVVVARVRMALRYAAAVDARDITVSLVDGVVRLSGQAHGADRRTMAIGLARNVRGVRDIDASLLMQ